MRQRRRRNPFGTSWDEQRQQPNHACSGLGMFTVSQTGLAFYAAGTLTLPLRHLEGAEILQWKLTAADWCFVEAAEWVV